MTTIYNPTYYGERTTLKGDKVKDFMAASAISDLYNGRPPEPIFEYYNRDRIIIGRNLPTAQKGNADVDPNDNSFILPYDIPAGDTVQISRTLYDAVRSEPEKDRPLVFIITTRVPHAILCILYAGILYTAGFGFYDEHQNGKILNALRSKGQHGIAHTIEEVNGAIYTSDYLFPQVQQGGKISWIGYLNDDMCQRITLYLEEARCIVYTGKIDRMTGAYVVSNNCNVIVNKKYSEASGFINRSATNCIRWVQQITGIQLNCGVQEDPAKCMNITVDEWNDIRDNYKNSDGLYEIIGEIQHRLKPNFCTRFQQTLGICRSGGKKRTRKIGKNRKNKRKNKSRAYKKKSRSYKKNNMYKTNTYKM